MNRPVSALLGLCCLFVACSADQGGGEVVVALRTDLQPMFDFDRVAMFVTPLEGTQGGGKQSIETSISSYVPGARLAEFEGLREGDYRLDLILSRSSDGKLVAERPTLFSVASNLAVTVPIDRSCLNVTCPKEDDPSTPEDESTLTACLGGQCVDPRCTEETPEFCGALGLCNTDSQCNREAECMETECHLGVCWAWAKPSGAASSCADGLWCHPDDGCLRFESEQPDEPTAGDPCSNGIIDGNELGVDCGGGCSPCTEVGTPLSPNEAHCYDGVQNDTETAVDCGGECTPCLDDIYPCGGVTDIPVHECRVLVRAHQLLGAGSLAEFGNWLTGTNPCAWDNVSCSGGHITRLFMQHSLLEGPIPEEVVNLRRLQWMIFGDGIDSLEEIGGIHGPIPERIGELTELEWLILDAPLESEIPAGVGNLRRLKRVQLYGLVGTIPAEIGNWTNVEVLRMRGSLSGTIPPEIGNLRRAQVINLSEMRLEGEIPASIGQLQRLNQLNLGDNFLEGAVPEEIMSLGTDTYIGTSGNLCLWTEDCGTLKTWLDDNIISWSTSRAPAACSPPPGVCQ